MKYSVGQRVIVKPENLCKTLHVGYFGHIVTAEEPDPTRNRYLQPVYYVHLEGRAGREAAPWMLSEATGFNPFGFFESEIEATD